MHARAEDAGLIVKKKLLKIIAHDAVDPSFVMLLEEGLGIAEGEVPRTFLTILTIHESGDELDDSLGIDINPATARQIALALIEWADSQSPNDWNNPPEER